MRTIAVLFVSCLIVVACGKPQSDERTEVDLVLHNATVITIDADLSIKSAVAIDGTDIVAVGGAELLDRYKSPDTRDLGGKVLMPGFNDTHTHLRGSPQRHIDLTKTRSIEQLKGQVRDKVTELGTGEWITGYGWTEDVMTEQRRPLRRDLDEAAPDNPVLLTRARMSQSSGSSSSRRSSAWPRARRALTPRMFSAAGFMLMISRLRSRRTIPELRLSRMVCASLMPPSSPRGGPEPSGPLGPSGPRCPPAAG